MPHFPRFRALALFGRRLQERVDSVGIPASKNLHNLRHCTRTRTWGLVEGHADPVLLAPDDVTRNVRAVRLKNNVETLGDVVGLGNLERRPRNGHVADQAINQAAGELNRSRHQYGVARDRASFHET